MQLCRLLGRRSDHGLAAHVRTQGLRNANGAVGVQVVLQERDQHAGRRHAGVVEGMRIVLGAVLPCCISYLYYYNLLYDFGL